MSNNNPPDSSAYEARFNEILEVYEKGRALEAQGRAAEARTVFESCLQMAAGMPLLINQYVDIRLCIAFSYADESNWPAALAIYHELEAMLKQEGEWYRTIPHDIRIMIPQSYDPALGLANVSDSIAIAYQKSEQVEKALPYYDHAIRTYTDLGNHEAAIRSWNFMGQAAREKEQWAILQQAGEGLLTLATQIKNVPQQIEAYRFLAQAHVNQRQLDKVAEYLRRAVASEQQIGSPYLKQDTMLLREIETHLGKAAPPKSKWWPFGR